MAIIGDEIELYKNKEGKLPSSLVELTKPQSAQAPYLVNLPKDPWGNEYFYFFNNKKMEYILGTYGSDGVWGGEELSAELFSHSKPCSIRVNR